MIAGIQKASDNSDLNTAYDRAVAHYIESVHSRVPEFCEQHFSLKGSLHNHRIAVGWDLLRAPVNAGASVATLAKHLGAKGAGFVGAKHLSERMKQKSLFLKTDLGQHLTQLLYNDLLKLPHMGPHSESGSDDLMFHLMQQPEIQSYIEPLLAHLSNQLCDERIQSQLEHSLEHYVDSRAAAADLSVVLVSAAAGYATLQQITPGAISLSSSIAGAIAHGIAINQFWAGPMVGKIYFSIVGVTTPALLSATVFASLMIPASILASFSGILTDPLQRRLGIHQRRLHQLVDKLEAQLLGHETEDILYKEFYMARLFDFIEWTQIALKVK